MRGFRLREQVLRSSGTDAAEYARSMAYDFVACASLTVAWEQIAAVPVSIGAE